MKKLLPLFLVSLLFLVSCKTEDTQSETASNSSVAQSDSDLKLLFFMNPNGRPCQIQDDELKGGELAQIPVEYIKTTVKADRKKFYDFGVRSLPTLILVDKENKVKKRFTPGIQQVAAINKAVSQLQ